MILEKRKMTKNGEETSLLGYGCMRFPITSEGKIDEPEAEKLLDRAIAGGVNYIDTAYPYHGGESEPFLGRVLKKYDRNSYYLATKLPLWNVKCLEDAKKIFNAQLERLQTDHFDFYLLHALGKKRWDMVVEEGIVEWLAQKKEEGVIRNYGFHSTMTMKCLKRY